MTPIEKNIIVIDEHGNILESTYKRRAKGLITKGRARYIDDNTICLIAYPSDRDSEDNDMSDSKSSADCNIKTANQDNNQENELSMDYIISSINQILNDTAHVHEAIQAIRDMSVDEGVNNQTGNESQCEAILDIISYRETTNQRMLGLLEKIYDDIKPSKPSDDVLKFQQLKDALCNYPPEVAADILKMAAREMFSAPGIIKC